MCMHARDRRCIARRLFRVALVAPRLTCVGVASPLARSRLLSPAHPRAARSDVRLTVPGFPATPFIIAADHGPAAPLVRSRGPLDSRLATRHPVEQGRRRCRSTLYAPNFLCVCCFIYSPLTFNPAGRGHVDSRLDDLSSKLYWLANV